MDAKLLKKTESQLYQYYEYKRRIHRFKRKIDDLEEQIISLDNQIRNVHRYIILDTMPPANGYSEKVHTSISGTSYMEKQMEQEVTKIERRKIEKIKAKIKAENKIMDMQSFIRIMDTNIENLSEEDKRFIEYLYGAKKRIPFIAIQLNLSVPTCYRHKDELLRNIADSMWMYK